MKPRRVVEIFLAVGVFAFIAGVVDRGVVLASGSDHHYELWSTGGAISAILLGLAWAMLAVIGFAFLTLLCIAVAKVFQRLRPPSREATNLPEGDSSSMSATRAATMLNAVILYASVLGGTLALQAARRERLHERRQHELALAAREAELRALNAQLEPRFLLNTLNSVLALVDTRPREARLMIERLSELLKAAFDEMEEPEVPLARELDLLEAYIGIEQVRFSDRLRVTVDVADALRSLRVPPFLLQPLVENAIKYAVAPVSGPVFIRIAAHLIGDRVRIEVIDSGRGFDFANGSHRGLGLQLTERRLRAHAPLGVLSVERKPEGFAVVVTFPL